MVSLLAEGNAYVAVSWGSEGSVLQRAVLAPALVTPEKRGGGYAGVGYLIGGSYLPPLTGEPGRTEILHLRGMTLPGAIVGINPIQACSETMGISLAAQKYGSSFFANDATPRAIVEVPAEAKLTPVGQEALRRTWKDLFGGPSNAGGIGVLVDGAKFTTVQVNPEEAQFRAVRQFQLQDVARSYGVTPPLLGDPTPATSGGGALPAQNTA